MSKPIYLFSISSHPDAISVNSLDISFFQPLINFSNYDYLILTSKQAVKALGEYKKEEYIEKKALCISTQTAKSYEQIGGNILELGSGYGDDMKAIIKKYPKETKWLYLRAEEVASKFALELQEESYRVEESIVYKSECSHSIENIKLSENAVLIFTSPSSVKCFLNVHTFSKKFDIIVIGKSTAKALPRGIKYRVSEKRTIESCIKLAQLEDLK